MKQTLFFALALALSFPAFAGNVLGVTDGDTTIVLDANASKLQQQKLETEFFFDDTSFDFLPTAMLKQQKKLEAARQHQQTGIGRLVAQHTGQASDCPDCPAMVRIPGENYEIGKTEVTQAEWCAVMGSNPPELKFKNCGDTCPVEKVSWNDAQEFIQKLNFKTGKKYRLPTKAEWEYACYGGSQTEYCGGNDPDAVAWTSGNSNDQTHPAGQKQANDYGLYDMTGNVWEWVNDCWKGDCAKRMLRGGSWSDGPRVSRASNHDKSEVVRRYNSIGFRLARTLP